MRIVTLEEHVSFPQMTASLPDEITKNIKVSAVAQQMMPKLADITGERLQSMNDTGVTMQVLSVENTDAYLLDSKLAPPFVSKYNDLLAEKIAGHQQRFAAFACLPMTAPMAAADELERAVKQYDFKGAMIKGLINGEFLDQPKFEPIFERAEKLGVPVYIHPGIPPKAVLDAYYSNIGNKKGVMDAIACWGWGWHAETAVHVLRLLAAGTFDKFPKLKIIVGHMGEMLPMMWTRSDRAFKPGAGGENQRSLADTFHDQVHITTSGFFTQPPLQIALDTFGIDNIMLSVDYPFSTNQMGIDFINAIDLPQNQVEKIAYKNADKLLNLSELV